MPDLEHNINYYLDQFRTATYGEDIRTALVEAIKLCYYDIIKQAKQGAGISNIELDQDSHLIITIKDPNGDGGQIVYTPYDLGSIKGDKGDRGDKGDPGDVTVVGQEIDIDGSLDPNSQNPVSNAALSAAFENKMDKRPYNSANAGKIITVDGQGGISASGKRTGAGTFGNNDSLSGSLLATEAGVKDYIGRNIYSKQESDNKYATSQDISGLASADDVYDKTASDARYVKKSDIDTEINPNSENPVQNSAVAAAVSQMLTVDDELSFQSENPVQNKVIYTALNEILSNMPDYSVLDSFLGENANSNNDFNALIIVPGLFIERRYDENYSDSGQTKYRYYLTYNDSEGEIINPGAEITEEIESHFHRLIELTGLFESNQWKCSNVNSLPEEANRNKYYPTIKCMIDYIKAQNFAHENPDQIEVPTKTSDLFNDSGFIPLVKVDSIDDCTENGILYLVNGVEGRDFAVFYYILNLKRISETNEKISWTQIKINQDVTISIRNRSSDLNNDWDEWTDFTNLEDTYNRVDEITNANKTSTDIYPSVKAVADYVDSHSGGGGSITVDSAISSTSENPVQNKVIYNALSDINGVIDDIKSELRDVEEYGGHIRLRGVSDPAFTVKIGDVDKVFSHFNFAMVKDGEVKYYLKKTNINLEKNSGFASVLDGTDGDMLIVNDIPIYYLINDDPTYDLMLFATKPFTYNGLTAKELKMRGDAPSLCYIDNINSGNTTDHYSMLGTGKSHFCRNSSYVAKYINMHYMTGKYVPSESNGNITYTYDSSKKFINSGAYRPTVYLDLATAEKAATNKNTGGAVYTNKDALSREIVLAMMYSEYGTRYLQSTSLFGSPFSGTTSTITSSLFEGNATPLNGLRFKDSNNEWVYNDIKSGILRNTAAVDVNTNFITTYEMLTDWNTPWEIMEQHLVLSYAFTNNIAPDTWFVYNENEYKYLNVGSNVLLNGNHMTGLVFKKFKSKLDGAYYNGADLTGNDIEWVIFSALYRGWVIDTSPHYWLTGLNIVLKSDDPLSYYVYCTHDYNKYIMDKYYLPTTLDTMYDFEKSYEYLGKFYSTGGIPGMEDHLDGCIIAMKTRHGDTISTYDCATISTSKKVANSTNYPTAHTSDDGVTTNTKIVTGTKIGYGPSDTDSTFNHTYIWHPREYTVAKAGYSSFVCQNVNDKSKDISLNNVNDVETKVLSITDGNTTTTYNLVVKKS